jgi:mevalonate kinase
MQAFQPSWKISEARTYEYLVMIRSYYANGKLLLSGEYLVLHGAWALAVPLKTGQLMQVETYPSSRRTMISWQAKNRDRIWFMADIASSDWTVISSTDAEVAGRLMEVLKAAGTLNPAWTSPGMSYNILTVSDFDMNWGFGSSSALIANVAKWFAVDPFDLLFSVSAGSGADIAAAVSSGPILYRLQNSRPEIIPVNFWPRFRRHIRFVFLGKKQNTEKSVRDFKAGTGISAGQLLTMNRLTDQILNARYISGFAQALSEHEIFMQGILGRVRIREERFPDFPGEIKSLGAWGGDVAMVASEQDDKVLASYFSGKGLNTLFSFDDLVMCRHDHSGHLRTQNLSAP